MKPASRWRARLLAAIGAVWCLLLFAAAPAGAAANTVPASVSTAAPAAASGAAPPGKAMPQDQQLFGQVRIPAGTVVREDIQMVAGNVQVNGHLTGSVTLTAGQVEVGPAGRIDGSVHIVAGQVAVQPGGRIGGDVLLSGRTPRPGIACPRNGPPCSLGGITGHSTQVHTQAHMYRPFGPGYPSGLRLLRGAGPWIGRLWFGFHILSWLGMLALALPVVALWPQAVESTGLQIRRNPGGSALVGLAAGVLALPVLVLVSITIIGLPVAFAAAAGLIAVWFFGYVALWQLLGAATLSRAGRDAPHPLLALAVGSFLLFLAGWIPILGGLVWLAASCLGVGATLRTRFGSGTPWLRRGDAPPPAS